MKRIREFLGRESKHHSSSSSSTDFSSSSEPIGSANTNIFNLDNGRTIRFIPRDTEIVSNGKEAVCFSKSSGEVVLNTKASPGKNYSIFEPKDNKSWLFDEIRHTVNGKDGKPYKTKDGKEVSFIPKEVGMVSVDEQTQLYLRSNNEVVFDTNNEAAFDEFLTKMKPPR